MEPLNDTLSPSQSVARRLQLILNISRALLCLTLIQSFFDFSGASPGANKPTTKINNNIITSFITLTSTSTIRFRLSFSDYIGVAVFFLFTLVDERIANQSLSEISR
jgi:hypothetical protein